MSSRIHCWHSSDLNRMQASSPPSEIYVCCFCGAQHVIHRVKPEGHGYYLPQHEGHWEALPKAQECPYTGNI